MSAGYLEIFLEQGETFSANISLDLFNGTSFNLADYNVKSEIRKSYWSEKTSERFTSSISANTGVIHIGLPASNTQNLKPGKYVYDIFITNAVSNNRSKVLEGIIFVEPSSTRI